MARPKSPLIDRETAVETALEMIDADGLAAFSMEGLSRRLGVRGPSLYHHFTDRADLLAHVAQLVLLEVRDPYARPNPGPWDETLVAMTLEFRRTMLRHPNAAPLLIDHFPRHLLLRVYEGVVIAFEAEGVPDEYHLLLFEGLEKLTLGSALYWTAAKDSEEFFGDVPLDDFPAVRRAVDANAFNDEAMFEAACRAFVAGVKHHIEETR